MENEPARALSIAKANGLHGEEAQNPQSGHAVAENSPIKRPRDVHTIHLILNHYGVTAYQERVPLQLMDFAYRYTSGILQDSLHFINESYPGLSSNASSTSGTNKNNPDAAATVNMSALRLAIRSRTHYQYNPNLSKEFYTDLMTEKNKIALPPIQADAGLHLPPEQYMLTGQHWQMGESFVLMETDPIATGAAQAYKVASETGVEGDEEPEGGTMEDVFGRPSGIDEDSVMED